MSRDGAAVGRRFAGDKFARACENVRMQPSVAEGRARFLRHIETSEPASLAEAEEFIERFQSVLGAVTGEDVFEDILAEWVHRGEPMRHAPEDDSEYRAEMANRRN